MQTILFLLNSAPYQDERVFNALRLATQLLKQAEVRVRIFGQSDAVYAPVRGQEPPHLKYNVATMLGEAIEGGAEVKLCGVCMDARGVKAEALISGAARSTMAELAEWTLTSDKILVF